MRIPIVYQLLLFAMLASSALSANAGDPPLEAVEEGKAESIHLTLTVTTRQYHFTCRRLVLVLHLLVLL